MTEKTPSQVAAKTGNTAPKKDKPNAAKSRKSGLVAALFVLVFVLFIAFAVALWWVVTSFQTQLEQQASTTQNNQTELSNALAQSEKALQGLNTQNEHIASLSKQLERTQAELADLNQAFHLVADRGSDLILINDIDHLVTIAQQQLQLSGNVANAIISLETAQAQLARANRPALAALQQTINGDLERLRAAKTVDIALLSEQLDTLAGLVAQAPLLVPDAAVPELESELSESETTVSAAEQAVSNNDKENWWQKAWASGQEWLGNAYGLLRSDMGQLFSVRRVDDAAALLISPSQATRFRDNLRLRIMTAQLALMMGQSSVWKTETAALTQAIETRFDEKSAQTRQALRIARAMADTPIDSALPTVNNSVKALEAVREAASEEP